MIVDEVNHAGNQDNAHLVCTPIRCTFEGCRQGLFDSASGFLAHLKNRHKLCVFQAFQVAPFLESYLNYYFTQDNCEIQIRSNFYSKDGITYVGATPENPGQLADALIRFKLEHSLLSCLLKQQKEDLCAPLEHEKCFICNEAAGQSYPEYLAHLDKSHGLVLGKAYNLVFLPEFIAVLRNRLLKNLCCIFCDNCFESVDAVKTHMQGKRHARINPLDTSFDKYYLINYQDDNWHGAVDSDSSWGEWQESDTEKIKCLFDDQDFNDFDDLFEGHLPEIHGLDLKKISRQSLHSFYDLVKIINYLRERVLLGLLLYL
ncbi:hypothetical protein DI09_46p30 [Mitosporidium daphniae]|uniref:C2H2-type domain-containing protein n=1 Tax=Mitosporidium daphniae TaxID=1485682 RepID=A0A098VPV1_9MICR|nr:uncharacterized protein DI09_46p30 [Mitosporidium daphniae]KGG51053.1 hypothetical protein DI09_46p30 [Mitosporidium daphniae]|eukprot:XP_013237499.1 uncharacterized protein DI09_46p30 [Mitosporidium daphniae]